MDAQKKNLESYDFSLVLGGPLFQMFRRAHLTGTAMELLLRRVLVISLAAWLPLLLLSLLSGTAWNRELKVSFLFDVEAHVRFLVALPALIAAEWLVHFRLRTVVMQFVERDIVVNEDAEKFHRIIDSTQRIRNSAWVEVFLIVFVYTLGVWIWRHQVALEVATWYAVPEGARLHFNLTGYWYRFVSIPIFQFILLRWYMRLVLWFSFLARVSRLNLQLMPSHPDRAGGLGFLGQSAFAFAPIVFAQGALLAGLIASAIFFEGKSLISFKVDIFCYVVFFVFFVFVPLLVFTPKLAAAKRRGLKEYGALASRYVKEFEEKWIQGKKAADEVLLGSSDIQSLADLGNSVDIVREMGFVPFGWQAVLRLIFAAVLPILPLLLTVIPLEQMIDRLIKAIV